MRAVADGLHGVQFDQAPPCDEWLTHKSSRCVFHCLPQTFVTDEIAAIALEHEAVFEYNIQWRYRSGSGWTTGNRTQRNDQERITTQAYA